MNIPVHKLRLLFAVVLIAGATSACASTTPYPERDEVREFIDAMSTRHQFASDELSAMFGQVNFRQDIIDAMTRPAEKRPWHEYRPIFINARRIDGGVSFREEHAELLRQAEEKYGVPAEIVTAIIGVETLYGRSTGRHRVVDALATLAFDYPARGSFFRGELEQYLILAREENFDPLAITGSYAGAMGKPQFIPSSYRHYAVDFDGDDRRDLLDNVADTIGSVANYLSAHNWRRGQPVASRIRADARIPAELIARGIKPHTSVAEYAALGITTEDALPADAAAAVIELEGADGPEYWLGLDNFYVITRYNRSSLYAMAVYQLSAEIGTRHRKAAAWSATH
ncbi:MAG: lytic murein transglycosylase B [Gammaproteobacteria bacterium]|jgi:membrane-bound lytic murein transglycosylase B|nr:lytic murein transglycosylase B [Gammaproteobacteria bacterium]